MVSETPDPSRENNGAGRPQGQAERKTDSRRSPGGVASGLGPESAGFSGEVFEDPRFEKLCCILRDMGHVAVAYSGGVDSVFLLRVAKGVLGDAAVGVLGSSQSLDQNEARDARKLAESMGISLEVLETREYDNPAYRANDGSRCYHCKKELFQVVQDFARENDIPHVLDGSNADDVDDYRPGMKAKNEAGVRSPLMEAGLDKESIRKLSRALGLPTWDKPAAPCLSSRIPHGEEVTEEKLRQVEAAEASLRALGFRVVRVRHHGQVARVEVPEAELSRFFADDVRKDVTAAVKEAGFPFVALDLNGFRSGSLNEVLTGQAALSLTQVEPLLGEPTESGGSSSEGTP